MSNAADPIHVTREERSLHSLAAFHDSKGHPPGPTSMYRYDPAAPDDKCFLRTSAEDHWVGHFASHILEEVRTARPKSSVRFHQFFEKPSLPSEGLEGGGYDLSIGPYDTEGFRIRTMHKTKVGRWCDLRWRWASDARDNRHVQSLLQLHKDHGFLPFLVMHVFYCVHDWRRMGRKVMAPGQSFDGLVVPDLAGPLRTVIVDLTPLQGKIREGSTVVVGCKGLDAAAKSLNDWKKKTEEVGFVYAKFEDESLPVGSLPALLKVIDDSWEETGRWRNSTLYAERPAPPPAK